MIEWDDDRPRIDIVEIPALDRYGRDRGEKRWRWVLKDKYGDPMIGSDAVGFATEREARRDARVIQEAFAAAAPAHRPNS